MLGEAGKSHQARKIALPEVNVAFSRSSGVNVPIEILK